MATVTKSRRRARDRQPTSEELLRPIRERAYIVVVATPPDFHPRRPTDVPPNGGRIMGIKPPESILGAQCYCRSFNREEMKCPYGLWAIVVPAEGGVV